MTICNPKPKALIFAAGFGTRLAPLTNTVPKPLIPVCGKPLIEYHIEKLVQIGVTELVINSHWLADKLVDHIGDGSRFGAAVQWSHEAEILNTGGGMKNALPLLGAAPFIVINADIWTEYNFARLCELRLQPGEAHLVMVANPIEHPEGDFAIGAQGRLVADSQQATFTYAGIGLFTAEFISRYPAESAAFPLREPLQQAVADNRVAAELYKGAWQDVGTMDRLAALEHKLTTRSGKPISNQSR